MRRQPEITGGKKGVVLLATLVFIFLLTVIVTLFIGEVEGRIRYRAQTAGDHDLRRIARDHLEFSLAVLEEFLTFDDGLFSASQGWGNPMSYAGYPLEYPGVEVDVRIEDMTSQLPLSRITEEHFLLLMESLGINSHDSARLRDSYFDWIDDDDEPRIQGAESREYEVDRRYWLTPRNAPIRELDELEQIAGFSEWLNPRSRYYDPGKMEQLRAMLSVKNEYPVNYNVMKPALYEFLRLYGETSVETILDYQAGTDRVPGTDDDRQLIPGNLPGNIERAIGSDPDGLFGFETGICRIRVDVRRHQSFGFFLEAIVDVKNGGTGAQESPSGDPDPEQVETPPDTPESEEALGSSGTHSFEILVIRENIVEFE